MGEYCVIANRSKEQYLNPHAFGHGVTPWEVLANKHVLSGLGILLMDTARISHISNPLIGSWIGDDIVIIGDERSKGDPYENVIEEYNDVSKEVRRLLLDYCIELPEDLTEKWKME
jgi:hypothetical protein